METNRRDFLKISGMAGLAGLTGAGMLSGCANQAGAVGGPSPQGGRAHRQVFNMHNYAAPALPVVRVGVIGVGSRGASHVSRLARIQGVDIKAVGDLLPDVANKVVHSIRQTPHRPTVYAGSEDAWRQMVERDDIDLILTAAPWHLHAPICVAAMENGKHAGTELPAGYTVEECWSLVETSERTRKHCMLMANSAYGDDNLMALNMARQGFFGEIIHGEGAYIHQLLFSHMFNKDAYQNMWRLRENATRQGNLYPQHGLGTIAQAMDLNNGDQMDYLVSMSSDDFMMGKTAEELAAKDPFFQEFVGLPYRGNMNTTTIRTKKGRTIVMQHDVTSPRPNVRFNVLSGTKGIFQAYPEPMIATSHDGWLSDAEFQKLRKEYEPQIVKKMGDISRQIGGHGGKDTLMLWRLIDCLRNGIPLDMSVYDAALWSVVHPLSEWSVNNRSNSIDVPDFTNGAWRTNERNMDIELNRGGTTGLV